MNAHNKKKEIFIRIFILHILSVFLQSSSCLSIAQENVNGSSNSFPATTPNIISRSEWLAKEPTQPPSTLSLPVQYVIISHTATQHCSSTERCATIVRNIQTYHMNSKNWSDIGYNFLIGGAGDIYAGRGWKNKGSHTKGYNSISIGIAFIGDFQNSPPTDSHIVSCKQLIAKGVEADYIQDDYKLFGARQLRITDSPGIKLFNEIKKWKHWAEQP